jgi:hypothetical protein
MKLYRDYALASTAMHDDPRLAESLRKVIRERKFTQVLETGSYLGLGSTRFIAEAFPAESPPEIFVTIETNWNNWRQAKRNLARFPFVRPIWGLTVDQAEAAKFIRQDEYLINHQAHPDIFIDDVKDPVAFYLNELAGRLGEKEINPSFREKLDRLFHWSGQDLLRQQLRAMADKRPLVVLDSAGGVGFLEFTTLLEVLAGKTYTLLLDDIHHIKHYRSWQHIVNDPSFKLLDINETHGWLLAQHG